jgi:hypothetical protein
MLDLGRDFSPKFRIRWSGTFYIIRSVARFLVVRPLRATELSPYIKALTLVYPGRPSTRSLWMILTEYAKLIQSAHTTFSKRASGNTFHVMDSKGPVITPGDLVSLARVKIHDLPLQEINEGFRRLLSLGIDRFRNDVER